MWIKDSVEECVIVALSITVKSLCQRPSNFYVLCRNKRVNLGISVSSQEECSCCFIKYNSDSHGADDSLE